MFDLALLIEQAHGNPRDPNFISVREMLDSRRTKLDAHVDALAGRIAQPGGIALGTTQAVARATSRPPQATDAADIHSGHPRVLDRMLWFPEAHMG
jgi:starvation-inducible DNA-binding protein